MVTEQISHTIFDATTLLPLLKGLKNHEKLYLIQFLVAELSKQQQGFVLPETCYAVWSPVDSYEAAGVMLQAIKKHKKENTD